MATLTNTKIKDTYDGLLKTTTNEAIGASGVTLIEDGLGNASALSVGRANNGVTITGNLAVDTNTLYVDAANNRVGVSTSSPADSLEVAGDTASAHRIRINNANASGSETLIFTQGSTIKSWIEYNNSTSNLDIWQYTPNDIRFGTNNGEKMRIDASGNVGIGTNSNSYTAAGRGNLNIAGSGGAILGFQIGGTAKGYVFHDNTNLQLWNESAGNLLFATSGTERMRIDSSGNVGIGTSSADDLMHLQGSEAVVGATQLTLESYFGGYGAGINFVSRTSNEGTRVSMAKITADGESSWGTTTSTQDAGLRFYTTENGSQSERMRIDSSGNVKINGSGILQIRDDGSYIYENNGLNIGNGGTGTGRPINFLTENTERMRIDSSGNVGIGRTPYSALGFTTLDIDGTNGSLFLLRTNGTTNFSIGTSSGNPTIKAEGGKDLLFDTNGSERMRINSNGYLKTTNGGSYSSPTSNSNDIETTLIDTVPLIVINSSAVSSGTNTGLIVRYPNASPNGSLRRAFSFEDSSAARFYVRSDGGIGNYQANDTNLSDERVKTDINPLGSYWDKFKALELVTFKYKDQTHNDNNIGLIAQQVESVAPEFVDTDGFDDRAESVEGEEPLKAIYTADLYHAAIKVLQEAMDKIETLEAKVATLESQLNA